MQKVAREEQPAGRPDGRGWCHPQEKVPSWAICWPAGQNSSWYSHFSGLCLGSSQNKVTFHCGASCCIKRLHLVHQPIEVALSRTVGQCTSNCGGVSRFVARPKNDGNAAADRCNHCIAGFPDGARCCEIERQDLMLRADLLEQLIQIGRIEVFRNPTEIELVARLGAIENLRSSAASILRAQCGRGAGPVPATSSRSDKCCRAAGDRAPN